MKKIEMDQHLRELVDWACDEIYPDLPCPLQEKIVLEADRDKLTQQLEQELQQRDWCFYQSTPEQTAREMALRVCLGINMRGTDNLFAPTLRQSPGIGIVYADVIAHWLVVAMSNGFKPTVYLRERVYELYKSERKWVQDWNANPNVGRQCLISQNAIASFRAWWLEQID